MSSCLPATGNSSTQMRHLAPRCRPLTGRPCPDGRHFFHHKDTSLPPALEPPVLQAGSSLIKRSCELEADMPPNQAHFSFPCEWRRKRGGRCSTLGGHQLLSFFLSFIPHYSDFCMCGSLQVSLPTTAALLDIDTIQKYSQERQNYPRGFLSLHGLLHPFVATGTRSRIELACDARKHPEHARIHTFSPGRPHSVLPQVRGPSAWAFSWSPLFPVRLQPPIQLQSQHQPDATGPLAGKGSASTHCPG